MIIQKLVFSSGDIITQKRADGSWDTIKILEIDTWPDKSKVAHCLTYNSSQSKPTIDSVSRLEVRIFHAPISASSFESGWECIGHIPVSKSEMVGFTEYLRLTDFKRYIEFTGQDVKSVISQANQHYKQACHFGDLGKRKEAIQEYTAAIDLFPLFYEAIDNRAFTFMELGDFKSALHDFEDSLRVNPTGVAAFFSRGECYMKLGDYTPAESIFREGLKKFPDPKDQALFQKHLLLVQSMKAKVPKTK